MDRRETQRADLRPRRGRPGATQVVVVIALPVLLGMAAVAVDIGRVAVEKQRLRQICDVGALEGAKDLPTTSSSQADLSPAEATARQYALANGADRGAVTLKVEGTPAAGDSGARLKVTASESVPMTFARIWGKESCQLHVDAVAEREPGPGWIPLAVDTTHQPVAVPLMTCAVGQWWVTAVNGQTIDFTTAFRDGAGIALNPGDEIALSRYKGRFHDGVLSAATERLQAKASGRDQVQVLVVDVPNVPDTVDEIKSRFEKYASVRITDVNAPKHNLYDALGIEWLATGAGPLGAQDTNGTGQVKLIE